MEDVDAVVTTQAYARGQVKKWRVTKALMIVVCHDVIFLISSKVLINVFYKSITLHAPVHFAVMAHYGAVVANVVPALVKVVVFNKLLYYIFFNLN